MTDSQMVHVLLVTGQNQISDWLMTTLRAEAGMVLAGVSTSLERAAALIGQRRVDVVLLDTSVPDAKQLERLQALAALPLSPAIIVMVDPGDMAFLQQAMFAGARGFLLKPFTQPQLIDAIRQAYGALVQQRQALSATAAPAPRDESAEIVALYSPKGGVGRTSLATSLAVALHQESRQRVTLVDGDLQFGDVDIAVNVMAHKSSADLLGYVNDLEPGLLDSVMIDHSSGIRLLLAPPHFDPTLDMGEGRLAHVIKAVAAAQGGGYVVVDAPAGLGETTLTLLDVARRVLLVTAASVASLRATKRFLELAAKMDYPDDKIVLVLSGYRKDADVPLDEIERHLSWPVAVSVPYDSLAMALALNQGQPIIVRDRNHAVSKAVVKLARHLGSATTAGASGATGHGAGDSPPASEGRFPSLSMARGRVPKQALGQ